MDDLAVLEWATGGAVAVSFGIMGYLNSRMIDIEKQVLELVASLRRDNERSLSDVWLARDKDRDQREKDQEASMAFRQYVLTSLSTKDDVAALETRISGAVRMVMNERYRRGDIDGRM